MNVMGVEGKMGDSPMGNTEGKGGPETKYSGPSKLFGGLFPRKGGGNKNTVIGQPGEGAPWPGPATPVAAPAPAAAAVPTPLLAPAPDVQRARVASLFTPTAVRRYGKPLASSPTAITARGYGFA
jgi:hypothetical protein